MSGVADTKASMSRPSTARQSVAEMKRHQAKKAAAKLAITGGAALAKEGEEECQEMLQSIAEYTRSIRMNRSALWATSHRFSSERLSRCAVH